MVLDFAIALSLICGNVIPDSEGLVAKSGSARSLPLNGFASHFVNLLKSEEAREQITLVVDGPIAGEAAALPRDLPRRPEPGCRYRKPVSLLLAGIFSRHLCAADPSRQLHRQSAARRQARIEGTHPDRQRHTRCAGRTNDHWLSVPANRANTHRSRRSNCPYANCSCDGSRWYLVAITLEVLKQKLRISTIGLEIDVEGISKQRYTADDRVQSDVDEHLGDHSVRYS